ncbi:MAG: hypothetical protein M3Q29_06125 [Chloroflexota bacterium]|nr:hypothetical protein [Chloroflexota bacterium]
MNSTSGREEGSNSGVPSAQWRRAADRLARYGWIVLSASVTFALMGGAVLVLAPGNGGNIGHVVVDACENPPCAGGGGLPGLQDIPWIIVMLGYALAILLAVPSLFAGIWDLLRGRWTMGAGRLLVVVGPLLVFILIEILPHVLNPCTIPYKLGSRDLPGICQTNPEWGADVEDRYHLLDHAIAGALPLAALYRLPLRRWRPDVGALRSPSRIPGRYRS